MNKYSASGVVFVTFVAAAHGAAAQDPAKTSGPTSAWFAGIGLGETSANIPTQTVDAINASLSAANGSAFTLVEKDSRSTTGKILLGYTFSRNFAVEGGYTQVGKSTVSLDFRSGLNSVGTFQADYKMTAWFIDAVGMLPLGEKWALIGRLGAAYGRTSVNMSGQPITFAISGDDRTETKVREKFGAGVDYNINSAFTVRVEWERYRMPDPFSDELINADAATLGLLYRF
jgi:OmpA-OmpF porin, OOP family